MDFSAMGKYQDLNMRSANPHYKFYCLRVIGTKTEQPIRWRIMKFDIY